MRLTTTSIAAVIIEIAEGRAAVARRGAHAHRLESPVSLLHQNAVGLPRRASGKRLRILVQIAIGAEQVFAAVVVEIVNSGGPAGVVTVAAPTRER